MNKSKCRVTFSFVGQSFNLNEITRHMDYVPSQQRFEQCILNVSSKPYFCCGEQSFEKFDISQMEHTIETSWSICTTIEEFEDINDPLRELLEILVPRKEIIHKIIKEFSLKTVIQFDIDAGDNGGGQKRRVAIAGVLAMKPEVLILDEPTAGLDPKGRDEILEQIAKLRKETGMTVILVSHSMEDVAKYVDRIIVMNKSRVMFDDEPKEVFRHYKELEEIGLAAPQITYIMQTLKAKGLDVDADITGVEEAKAAILRALAGKRQSGLDRGLLC